MKKLYLILGWLILMSSLASAQNRLIQENRIWEYFHYLGYDCWIERFCFDGTQERNGKIYNQWKLIHKISWTTFPETDPVETPIDEVKALLREEDGKVYILLERECIREYNSDTKTLSAPFEAGEAKEAILYDFTISKGDTYPGIVDILWMEGGWSETQPTLSNVTVVETESLQLRDTSVIEYTLQPDVTFAIVKSLDRLSNMDWENEEIILDGDDTSFNKNQVPVRYAEVLGNVGRGNMTTLMPYAPIFLTSGIMDYHVSRLTSVYDSDGTVIYGNPSKIISPELQPSQSDNKIYDLYGNQVSKTIPGSIYIMNGKKYVAK